MFSEIPNLYDIYRHKSLFPLWNTREDILKNVSIWSTDFLCMDKHSFVAPQKKCIQILEQHWSKMSTNQNEYSTISF